MNAATTNTPATPLPVWIRLSIIAWVLAAVALLLIVRQKEIAMGGEPAFRHFGATLRNACLVLAAVNAGLAAAAAWRRRWDVALRLLAGLAVLGGSLAWLYIG